MGTSFSFTETLIKVLVYTKWKSLKSFQKNLKNACFLLWSSSLLIFLTTVGKNELERFHINRLLKARKITTHDGPGSWRRLLLNWNDASRFTVSNFQSRLTTSSKHVQHVHSEPHHFDCTSVFTRSTYYGLVDKMLNVIIKYTFVNQQQRGRE